MTTKDMWGKALPVAGLVIGAIATLAWIGFLGYGLARLLWRFFRRRGFTAAGMTEPGLDRHYFRVIAAGENASWVAQHHQPFG